MAAHNPLSNIPALIAPVADHVNVDHMGGTFLTKQVDIFISKNQALQMLCLKRYVYKTS